MTGLFKFSETKNFHLSVGAVLFDEQHRICLHQYFEAKTPQRVKHLLGGLDPAYHVMRETLEDNESLETAVLRGIKEEFSATGVIEKFLGTIVTQVKRRDGRPFEKTTPYFAVRLEQLGERDRSDAESHSELLWLPAYECLELFKQQETMTDREELHEAVIIERFIDVYGL